MRQWINLVNVLTEPVPLREMAVRIPVKLFHGTTVPGAAAILASNAIDAIDGMTRDGGHDGACFTSSFAVAAESFSRDRSEELWIHLDPAAVFHGAVMQFDGRKIDKFVEMRRLRRGFDEKEWRTFGDFKHVVECLTAIYADVDEINWFLKLLQTDSKLTASDHIGGITKIGTTTSAMLTTLLHHPLRRDFS